MKRLLCMLAMITSLTVSANEYDRVTGYCEFTGTEQDAFNWPVDLPYSLTFDWAFAHVVGDEDNNTSKVEMMWDVSNTTDAPEYYEEQFASIEHKLYFERHTDDGLVRVNIGLDQDELVALLRYMGAYRVGMDAALPSVYFEQVTDGMPQTKQSHLEIEDDYGLSYHVTLECFQHEGKNKF